MVILLTFNYFRFDLMECNSQIRIQFFWYFVGSFVQTEYLLLNLLLIDALSFRYECKQIIMSEKNHQTFNICIWQQMQAFQMQAFQMQMEWQR